VAIEYYPYDFASGVRHLINLRYYTVEKEIHAEENADMMAGREAWWLAVRHDGLRSVLSSSHSVMWVIHTITD
jgi:hypothetical protein